MSALLREFELIRSFPVLAASYWTITPKVGSARPFVLNPSQKVLQRAFDNQRKARKPRRAKVLKYRQGGISTYCAGMMQHCSQTVKGWTSLSIADKEDLPAQWLRRARGWLNETPLEYRPTAGATNSNELWFSKLNSRYYIGSEKGVTPGMGYTVRGFHGSEVASWTRAKAVLDDLMPAIPHHPDTLVVFESTGEAVSDYWYDSWWASRNGEDGYEALFLPWFLADDYHQDASDITVLSDREREIVTQGKQWIKENPEYAAVSGFVGVTPEQLAWRRVNLIGEPFYSNADAWACKYPSSPEEAFIAGGLNEFNAVEVKAAFATVRPVAWRGDIRVKSTPAEYSLEPRTDGSFLVWEQPIAGSRYVLGADVQWGDRY